MSSLRTRWASLMLPVLGRSRASPGAGIEVGTAVTHGVGVVLDAR